MDNKKIVKQYFNKYFKQQYFTEDDHEFKSLVRILNKKDKLVKNLTIQPVVVPKVELSNLDEAIKKAKPNMDKIKDVDKHIDSIR